MTTLYQRESHRRQEALSGKNVIKGLLKKKKKKKKLREPTGLFRVQSLRKTRTTLRRKVKDFTYL
jgi:hypothetical protein